MAFAVRSAVLALGLLFGGVFAASPLIAAFRLNEAITRADTRTIEASVDFTGVRNSLKASISALMVADAEARRARMGYLRQIGYRIGDTFAPYLIDRVLAKQVSPQGFIAYMRAPLPPGMPKRTMLQSIERARYTGLARFEIDVRDRRDQTRHYRAVFTRAWLTWRLTEVHVLPPRRNASIAAGAAP
jgi:hypothetical protein